MSEQPYFQTVEQAVRVLWPVTIRLAGLLMWTAIALLHTALLTLALLALWATQTTPADLASAARLILHTWPAAALGTAGVSAAGLAGAYWWLLKRLRGAFGAPLADYLLRASAPS